MYYELVFTATDNITPVFQCKPIFFDELALFRKHFLIG